MAVSVVTEQDLRMFLMDYPAQNTLTGSIRWDQAQIEKQLLIQVDKFNLLNPPTGVVYGVSDFPFHHLLLLGQASHLLKSLQISESLNQYQVQGEGIQVSDRDKGPAALQLQQQFDQEFREMAQQIKLNQNIQQVYGTTYSEYIHRARG